LYIAEDTTIDVSVHC